MQEVAVTPVSPGSRGGGERGIGMGAREFKGLEVVTVTRNVAVALDFRKRMALGGKERRDGSRGV